MSRVTRDHQRGCRDGKQRLHRTEIAAFLTESCHAWRKSNTDAPVTSGPQTLPDEKNNVDVYVLHTSGILSFVWIDNEE